MPTSHPSLTLILLQAREAAMSFFRPSLNQHGLTEQQWRIIRILQQSHEMEIHQLARQACILKPSMSGVLSRMERDGMVRRWKVPQDQRRVYVSLTDQGQQSYVSMNQDVERNYNLILEQFGEKKLQMLLSLLNEFRQLKP